MEFFQYRTDDKDCESHDCCSICIESFSLGENLVRTPCNHVFHEHCLSRWLDTRDTCPVCRHDIEEHLNYSDAEIIDLIPSNFGDSNIHMVNERINDSVLDNDVNNVNNVNNFNHDSVLETYFRFIENNIDVSGENQNNINIIANTLRNPDIDNFSFNTILNSLNYNINNINNNINHINNNLVNNVN